MNKIFKKSCNEPALFTHRPSLLNCPGRLAGVTGILLEPGFPGAVITDRQRACFKPLLCGAILDERQSGRILHPETTGLFPRLRVPELSLQQH
jgi:hypothetical protein